MIPESFLFTIICDGLRTCTSTYQQVDELKLISYENRHYFDIVRITFQNSTFKDFPENLLSTFPSVGSVVAQDCGISLLPAIVFGGNFTFPNVVTLILSKNKLIALEQSSFMSLPNLEGLDLSENQINLIHKDAFNGLPNLRMLLLGQNQMKRVHAATFLTLTALENVDLQWNLLRKINFNIFQNCHRLSKILLNNNNMESIQTESQNQVIKYIDMRSNAVPDIEPLGSLQQLEALDLTDCTNLNFDGDSFNKMVQLKKLYLDNANLQRFQKEFYFLLEPMKNLEELSMARNSLQNLDFSRFPDLPRLNYLDISDNHMDTIDVDGMKNKFPFLTTIKMCFNKLPDETLTSTIERLNDLQIRFDARDCERSEASSRNVPFNIYDFDIIRDGR
jgi:hypothetical protein